MKRLLVLVPFLLVAVAAPALAATKPDPVTWCGTDETAQDRVPDLEVSSSRQIRFVYAIPSDGVDNFLTTASGIATDAAWMDAWWQSQDPTRTPRFDRYPFPNCASKFGQLDIGFIRLPNPAAYYLSVSSPSLRLDRDLASAFPPNQKTVVYYDSPVRDGNLCGVTDYLSDTDGGAQGIVYLFLQSSCDIDPLGSGGSAEVATHELTHNLGAVPSGAPNECPDSASHVCDSTVDLMYPYLDDGSTLDSVSLDVNHDDYYAHGGTQWDVQDSPWLTHLPQLPFSLSVAGSGTLTARAGPDRLACSTGCSNLTLDSGTMVSIQATPAPGWSFSAWSGGCAGSTAACTLAVGVPTDTVATFVKTPPLRLTVAVRGRGKVTSSPGGISCPSGCKVSLVGPVRLTAKPGAGWKFSRWGGICAGRSTGCTVGASGTVRASFVRR